MYGMLLIVIKTYIYIIRRKHWFYTGVGILRTFDCRLFYFLKGVIVGDNTKRQHKERIENDRLFYSRHPLLP